MAKPMAIAMAIQFFQKDAAHKQLDVVNYSLGLFDKINTIIKLQPVMSIIFN